MEQNLEASNRREKLVKVGLTVDILDLDLSAEEKFLLLAALGRVQLEAPSDAVLRAQVRPSSRGGLRAKLSLRSSTHSFDVDSRAETVTAVVRQIEEMACAELAAWRKSRL